MSEKPNFGLPSQGSQRPSQPIQIQNQRGNPNFGSTSQPPPHPQLQRSGTGGKPILIPQQPNIGSNSQPNSQPGSFSSSSIPSSFPGTGHSPLQLRSLRSMQAESGESGDAGNQTAQNNLIASSIPSSAHSTPNSEPNPNNNSNADRSPYRAPHVNQQQQFGTPSNNSNLSTGGQQSSAPNSANPQRESALAHLKGLPPPRFDLGGGNQRNSQPQQPNNANQANRPMNAPSIPSSNLQGQGGGAQSLSPPNSPHQTGGGVNLRALINSNPNASLANLNPNPNFNAPRSSNPNPNPNAQASNNPRPTNEPTRNPNNNPNQPQQQSQSNPNTPQKQDDSQPPRNFNPNANNNARANENSNRNPNNDIPNARHPNAPNDANRFQPASNFNPASNAEETRNRNASEQQSSSRPPNLFSINPDSGNNSTRPVNFNPNDGGASEPPRNQPPSSNESQQQNQRSTNPFGPSENASQQRPQSSQQFINNPNERSPNRSQQPSDGESNNNNPRNPFNNQANFNPSSQHNASTDDVNRAQNENNSSQFPPRNFSSNNDAPLQQQRNSDTFNSHQSRPNFNNEPPQHNQPPQLFARNDGSQGNFTPNDQPPRNQQSSSQSDNAPLQRNPNSDNYNENYGNRPNFHRDDNRSESNNFNPNERINQFSSNNSNPNQNANENRDNYSNLRQPFASNNNSRNQNEQSYGFNQQQADPPRFNPVTLPNKSNLPSDSSNNNEQNRNPSNISASQFPTSEEIMRNPFAHRSTPTKSNSPSNSGNQSTPNPSQSSSNNNPPHNNQFASSNNPPQLFAPTSANQSGTTFYRSDFGGGSNNYNNNYSNNNNNPRSESQFNPNSRDEYGAGNRNALQYSGPSSYQYEPNHPLSEGMHSVGPNFDGNNSSSHSNQLLGGGGGGGIGIFGLGGQRGSLMGSSDSPAHSALGSEGGAGGGGQSSTPSIFQSVLAMAANATATPPVTASSNLVDVATVPSLMGHQAALWNGQLLVFGGFVDQGTSNKTYLLDNFKHVRCQQLDLEPHPEKRERHSAHLVKHELFVFGGYHRGSDSYYNDTWLLNTEKQLWSELETTGTLPTPRCGFSSCAIDNYIFVFGGRGMAAKKNFWQRNLVEYYNDFYVYNTITQVWTKHEPRGIGPSPRALATLTAVNRKLYLFGGAMCNEFDSDDTSGFCDLYELDVDTMTWNEVETKGLPPLPSYGHTATHVGDGKILLHGGKGFEITNGFSQFDTKTKTWTAYRYAGNILPKRWAHSATLIDRTLVLLGGRSVDGYLNTLNEVNVDTELVEVGEDENSAANDLSNRKELEEEKRAKQTINVLQNQIEELRYVVSVIGEELINQREAKEHMLQRMRSQQSENISLLQRMEELISKT